MSESDRSDREEQAREQRSGAASEPPHQPRHGGPVEHDVAYYDSLFTDIVAHWDQAVSAIPDEERTAAGPQVERPNSPGGPATQDPTPPAGRATGRHARQDPAEPGRRTDRDQPEGVATPDAPASSAASGWRSYEVAEDPDDEHFVPPPPQPLPSHDPTFYGALLGLVAGPLLLLYLVLFDRTVGRFWIGLSILLILGGFALLVIRQPRRRSGDDDGARL